MRVWSFLLYVRSTKAQLDLECSRCSRRVFNALILERFITRWICEQNPGCGSGAQQRCGKSLRLPVTADLSLIKLSHHFTIHASESKTPNFGSRTPSFESGIGGRSCSTDSRGTVVDRAPRLGPDEAPLPQLIRLTCDRSHDGPNHTFVNSPGTISQV